jgi:hypothetical protein
MPTRIPIRNLEVYGWCDPAAGKKARIRTRSARQAIIIVARDWLDRWFELYHWAGRLTPTQLKNKVLDVYEKIPPTPFRD